MDDWEGDKAGVPASQSLAGFPISGRIIASYRRDLPGLDSETGSIEQGEIQGV